MQSNLPVRGTTDKRVCGTKQYLHAAAATVAVAGCGMQPQHHDSNMHSNHVMRQYARAFLQGGLAFCLPASDDTLEPFDFESLLSSCTTACATRKVPRPSSCEHMP